MNPYVPIIIDTANEYGVPPSLALKVAYQESRFNPNAVSPAGARGIMQLEPPTARDLGVDINDPTQNIEGGVRYLGQMLARYKNKALALAGYNAGPGRVDAYLRGRSGLPMETQNYVSSITNSSLPEIINKGPTVAQNTPALSQAASGGPGALFGGGRSFDIGRALESLGAGMMAPYNPTVAATIFRDQTLRDTANKNKFGLTPVWTRDAAGNYVPLQMNSAGGAVPVQLPNGLKAVLPTTQVDLGGNGVAIIPRGATTPATVLQKAGPIGTDERPTGTGSYEAVPGSQTAGKITPRETATKGQNRLSYDLGALADNYTKLYQNGGEAGPAEGISGNLKNAGAYLSNTEAGQFFGRMFGTQNQSTRNVVNAMRSSLINSIRQATGMSARSMDSNTELQFYLQMATDPQNDYIANLAAIDALDKQYGSGQTLKQHLPPAIYRQVQQHSQALLKEHPLDAGSSEAPADNGAISMPGGITIRRIK